MARFSVLQLPSAAPYIRNELDEGFYIPTVGKMISQFVGIHLAF